MSSRNLEHTVQRLRTLLCQLNRWSREDLLQLPGLGSIRAKRILKAREERGGMSLCQLVGPEVKLGTAFLNKAAGSGSGDVVKYIRYYESLVKDSGKLQECEDVVSLDIGPVNSAYTHLNANFTLAAWGKLAPIMTKPYRPSQCYEQVKTIVTQLPQASVYVLESQSHQPRLKTFLEISIHLRALEAMFYVLIQEKKHSPTYIMLPRMIAQYFGVTSIGNKKQATTRLVDKFVDNSAYTPLGNALVVSQSCMQQFYSQKKQDDMSDSLLQAVAFLEWRHMSHLLCP